MDTYYKEETMDVSFHGNDKGPEYTCDAYLNDYTTPDNPYVVLEIRGRTGEALALFVHDPSFLTDLWILACSHAAILGEGRSLVNKKE